MKWEQAHAYYETFRIQSSAAIKKFNAGLMCRYCFELALREADDLLKKQLSTLRLGQ